MNVFRSNFAELIRLRGESMRTLKRLTKDTKVVQEKR